MMIKLEKEQVVGLEPAIRGMRNPMNSWEKSDSWFMDNVDTDYDVRAHAINGGCDWFDETKWTAEGDVLIGPNDLDLMKRLAAGGPVHAKYRRMITVYVDITAPI